VKTVANSECHWKFLVTVTKMTSDVHYLPQFSLLIFYSVVLKIHLLFHWLKGDSEVYYPAVLFSNVIKGTSYACSEYASIISSIIGMCKDQELCCHFLRLQWSLNRRYIVQFHKRLTYFNRSVSNSNRTVIMPLLL